MSGRIPSSFIDDLLQRTDLVELVDSFIPLKKQGNSYSACCPFHSEKSPSFYVVPKKQYYHCFGCGAAGNAIGFIMNYLNQGFTQTVETLAARLGLSVPYEGKTEKAKTDTDLYKLLKQVSTHYQNQLKQNDKAIAYLQERGLSGDIAKTYELGFAPEGWHHVEQTFSRHKSQLIATGMLVQTDDGKIYDRYRNRIMFPIHDRHGRIIGFGGRVLDNNQKPKYLNSPETAIFQKNRELYGLHQILSQNKSPETIIIVEGYMDVIALAQFGIANAVATLGTATSTFHIQLLAKHCKHLIFCFDGDEAGRNAAWKGLESSLAHLNTGLDASFMFLPQGLDPDDLVRTKGKEGFLEVLKAAIPLHQFFFETLSQTLNLQNPSGKTQLINLAKPYLQKIAEGSYKQLIMDELSRLTRLENHRLISLVAEQNPAKPNTQKTINRTPIRIAIALLLQNPELYAACEKDLTPSQLDEEEHLVLLKLIQKLIANPHANTAILLESWRDDPYFESIQKLAAWDHQVPEQELVREFIDIMLFLQNQTHERRIRLLLEKSRRQGLSEEERLNLQQMLAMKKTKTPGIF